MLKVQILKNKILQIEQYNSKLFVIFSDCFFACKTKLEITPHIQILKYYNINLNELTKIKKKK